VWDNVQQGSPVPSDHNAMNRHLNQSRLWRATGCAVCLLAILAMLGGHWMVLQSFAWARMIHEFSKQGSLRSAIVMTFDGKHPCNLCLTIQNGRQQEQAEDKNLPCTSQNKPFELLCEDRRAVVPLPPVAAAPAVPTVPRGHADFIESPPTPPPRAA